jgi:hypothetical protein
MRGLTPDAAGRRLACIVRRRGADMKRQFGSILARVFRGGARLSDEEHALACSLVESLPADLQSVVSMQFDSYNLVQREVDRRALNFYRLSFFGRPLPPTQLLKMTVEEAPLIRITAKVAGDDRPLHATLSAVNGQAFCIAFDRPVPKVGSPDIVVSKVTQAWRSNFEISDADA